MRIRKSGRSLVGRQGCSAAIREQFSNASPTLQHLNYSFYMQHLTHSCIPIILFLFQRFLLLTVCRSFKLISYLAWYEQVEELKNGTTLFTCTNIVLTRF